MSEAILDADVIAYMAAAEAVNHEDIHWGDAVVSYDAGLFKAFEVADTMVTQWTKGAECTSAILAFSGDSYMNFRRDVNPEYKAHRSNEKPEMYPAVCEYLADKYPVRSYTNLEGDDVLGMLLTEPGHSRVVVSTDKDIWTLPGHLVHVKKSKLQVVWNSEADANYYWMMQTLTGDPVDGYRGAPGVGVKGAEATLRGSLTLTAMWPKVLRAYENQMRKPRWAEKFITNSAFEEALINARCARILRWGDYDFDTEEVKLWSPN